MTDRIVCSCVICRMWNCGTWVVVEPEIARAGRSNNNKDGQILKINGTAPTRQNLRSIEYLDYVLNPRPEMQLELEYPSGEKQKVEVKAKLTMSPDLVYRAGAGVRYDIYRRNENVMHRMRMQWVQLGDVVILKFPWFFYLADHFYELSGKIQKGKALIVDLRGNPGGSVDTLKYFIGGFSITT